VEGGTTMKNKYILFCLMMHLFFGFSEAVERDLVKGHTRERRVAAFREALMDAIKDESGSVCPKRPKKEEFLTKELTEALYALAVF
jgi:hypothetical protein